ncbi:MAG: hypothetical protein N2738_00960 [Thermodesulfovibrionales bacterium]|nr:hypothetical protein [Thermodesulfovibrionales bacterium]
MTTTESDGYEFLLEFISVKTGAGMTAIVVFIAILLDLDMDLTSCCYCICFYRDKL